ncbi:MAG: response regulator, partial [Verrucomicrobia bacterium]|nr:response regulator [Verrucomicrobiota bacterium]
MDNPTPDITVLFVDDDQAFLETVADAFRQLSQNHWHILAAHLPDQAIAHLASHPVDLVVLDVRMPQTSGLDLLRRLNTEFPAPTKVMFTSAADAATRIAGLENGAALFLEKPGGIEGLESVFATLGELVKWHRKQHSRGASARAGLVEIVKLECASGNSRLIDVTAGDATGLVYIKAGSILHAEAPGRRGQSAFTFLASHPEAQFVLKEFAEPPERSVTRQWEFLVMEAFQLRDQLAQAAQDVRRKEPPAEPKPTESESPPPRALQEIAAATPPHPLLEMAPTTPAPSADELRTAPGRIHSLFLKSPTQAPAATPPPPPPAPPNVEHLQLDTSPATLTLGVAIDDASRAIDEMLVCTRQNEVLYEWRCSKTDLRLRCLDLLRHKAQQTERRLALGPTNRFDFQSTQGRFIVRLQGDTTILVRSTASERPPANRISPFNLSLGDWVSRHLNVKGLLACGLVREQLILVSCSYSSLFPSESLNLGWR